MVERLLELECPFWTGWITACTGYAQTEKCDRVSLYLTTGLRIHCIVAGQRIVRPKRKARDMHSMELTDCNFLRQRL